MRQLVEHLGDEAPHAGITARQRQRRLDARQRPRWRRRANSRRAQGVRPARCAAATSCSRSRPLWRRGDVGGGQRPARRRVARRGRARRARRDGPPAAARRAAAADATATAAGRRAHEQQQCHPGGPAEVALPRATARQPACAASVRCSASQAPRHLLRRPGRPRQPAWMTKRSGWPRRLALELLRGERDAHQARIGLQFVQVGKERLGIARLAGDAHHAGLGIGSSLSRPMSPWPCSSKVASRSPQGRAIRRPRARPA